MTACKTLQAQIAQLEDRLHKQRQRQRKKNNLESSDPTKAPPAPAVTDELSHLHTRLKRQSIITRPVERCAWD